MDIVVAISLALALDSLLGEPRRYHPLVFFGNWADYLEIRFNDKKRRIGGVIAWCLAVLPVVLVVYCLDWIFSGSPLWSVIWSAIVLYLALGWTSLMQHAKAVLTPLSEGDIDAARNAVACLVSRDTADLESSGIAKATTESVLENGADAIFGALFWFVWLGAPGVVLYRLANTLDAMWGYKSARYLEFGWFAARFDDALNLLPAQLTALAYSLLGDRERSFHCWFHQGPRWKSFNAGSVMAAGAGSIQISLGGDEVYQGERQQRPVLGPELDDNTRPNAAGIDAACRLVNRALALWFVGIAVLMLTLR